MADEVIVLGGGCFWCAEAVFEMFKGVKKTTVGYAGGEMANPTYEQVSHGKTGHIEVLRIEFDPEVVALGKLLKAFFAMHDPTSRDRQGADIGPQYRSIIFYTTDRQKKAAEEFIRKEQSDYGRPIVTVVERLGAFYAAEDYHQRYFDKNPGAAYCGLVVRPKVEKIKKTFKGDLAGS